MDRNTSSSMCARSSMSIEVQYTYKYKHRTCTCISSIAVSANVCRVELYLRRQVSTEKPYYCRIPTSSRTHLYSDSCSYFYSHAYTPILTSTGLRRRAATTAVQRPVHAAMATEERGGCSGKRTESSVSRLAGEGVVLVGRSLQR